MKIFYVLILTFAVASLSFAQRPNSATTKPAAKVNWGSVSEGKFTSGPLGLTITLPEDYILISTAESDLLSNAGSDLLKQGPSSDRAIDAAINRSVRLVAISEKQIGTLKNSVLEVVAVKQPAGVTSKMSLAANVGLLKGGPLTLTRTLGQLKIGRNTFSAADLDGKVATVTFKQRMYVVIHKGFSILVAITYDSDEQLTALEEVLGTMTLTK